MAEGLSEDGAADIDDPLLGHLLKVRLVRQVASDVGLSCKEVADLLQSKVLVLRHENRLYGRVLKVPLPRRQDVLEEVDGHIV